METPLLRAVPAAGDIPDRYDLELPCGRQMLDMTMAHIVSLAESNHWNVFFAGQHVGYIGRWGERCR